MRGIVQTIVNMIGALLFAFAVASPAIAEVGCSIDTAAHVSPDAAIDADHAFTDGDPDDHDPAPDPDGHCAFSHGHCGGIPAMIATAVQPTAPRLFAPPPGTHFTSIRLLGPDRPPRA